MCVFAEVKPRSVTIRAPRSWQLKTSGKSIYCQTRPSLKHPGLKNTIKEHVCVTYCAVSSLVGGMVCQFEGSIMSWHQHNKWSWWGILDNTSNSWLCCFFFLFFLSIIIIIIVHSSSNLVISRGIKKENILHRAVKVFQRASCQLRGFNSAHIPQLSFHIVTHEPLCLVFD